MRRWGCALFNAVLPNRSYRSASQPLEWFSKFRATAVQGLPQQPRSLTILNPAARRIATGGNTCTADARIQTVLAAQNARFARSLTTDAAAPVTQTPQANIFAVVEVGGKQYKVCPNDRITTEKVVGKRVGEELTIDKVLLIGTSDGTKLGQPTVPGAHVMAVVEQQTLSQKVYTFKKRRRKNSRRLRGYRASVTSLRIMSIHNPV